ncbi:MAG TPA: TIR domain-containing protein [Thermoanaerobaculia bacterium]|nr:TIR domain-containing protein [Thermoanaerobaculia bacterium]
MFTKQQMLSALDGLIAEAERLHQEFLRTLGTWNPDFVVWLKACESTIEAIFGSTSQALLSFRGIYFLPPPDIQFTNELERAKAELTWFGSGLRYARMSLIGYRYSVERLASEELSSGTPYIFVSHGGPSLSHVSLVRDFLVALGLAPVIVRDAPNLNLSINEKVRFYMEICAGAIALATVEDETTAHEHRTRPNVENEIGMLQLAPNIGSRIVYLKEPEVKFASNYEEKVWISFDKERVQESFIELTRELRAFGFLG